MTSTVDRPVEMGPARIRVEPCVLLKYGELALKRGNRQWFEGHLVRNVRHALTRDGESAPKLRLRRRAGVLVVSAPPLSQADILARLTDVIGVSVVQPVWRVPRSASAAGIAAVRLLRERHPHTVQPTFAVRCRRRDKRFPLTSEQLAATIGAHIFAELRWGVDLEKPDVELAVEIDRREIFLGFERYPGQGGLPVGSSGHALVLLSGGIDSAVAAYRAMRRGLRCDFLHCSGAPYTNPSSAYKAYALARHLRRFQPGSRLFIVPVGRAQKSLALNGAGEVQTVAHRRLYLRLADALAARIGAQALITGDSLGQVASQTLSNITTADQVTDLPVLRPLVAYDKAEIIAEGRRIGTAEIAALPGADCCQLFQPRRVATHSSAEQLARIEARSGVDTALDEMLAHMQEFELDAAAS